MVIMTAAIAFAFAACGNKKADATSAEEAKDTVEAAAETASEALSENEQIKAEMQEIFDKIRAAKSMDELETIGKELDPKFKEITDKIKENPELEQFVASLGDDFNFEKVMDKKIAEFLK